MCPSPLIRALTYDESLQMSMLFRVNVRTIKTVHGIHCHYSWKDLLSEAKTLYCITYMVETVILQLSFSDIFKNCLEFVPNL